MRRVSAFNLLAILLGVAFLYLPIVVLVIYSFNASRLVTVWGGWSTHWYAELIADAPLVDSAFISLAWRLFRRPRRRFWGRWRRLRWCVSDASAAGCRSRR